MPRGDNPKSKANLRVPSSDKARELGSKGGKASGKARQARKTLREELLALLEQGDAQTKMSLALILQAQEGNTRAYELIRDTIGEKPVDRIAVSSIDENTVKELKSAVAERNKDGAKQG